MSEPTDKEALEAFEDLPQEKRDAMRSAIRKFLVGMAEERGIPAERLVTPEVVDELAVELLRSPAGDVNARMAEFFTKEERGTIYKEEKARLTKLYPEGIPAGMKHASACAGSLLRREACLDSGGDSITVQTAINQ